MRGENEQVIFLKDYAPSPYVVEHVELDVSFAPDVARVRSLLTIAPREGTPPATPLVLDGDELKLASIAIDGRPLPLPAYVQDATTLTIIEPPRRRFVLETEVTLNPEGNVKLMGLYRSNGTWCTQCEPEGFRRITFYLDRPRHCGRPPLRRLGGSVPQARLPVCDGRGGPRLDP
jgi:aminopeptidase N